MEHAVRFGRSFPIYARQLICGRTLDFVGMGQKLAFLSTAPMCG